MNMSSPEGAGRWPALRTLPPHRPRLAVARPRLTDRLLAASIGPLTAIVAGPGYGKTSLLAELRLDLIMRGGDVAWLSLDAEATPVQMIRTAVDAIADVGGLEVIDVARNVESDFSIVSELLLAVHQRARQTYLLIDDLHLLGGQTAADFCHYLATNAPPNFHLIVASRVEPAFALQELAAYGNYQCLSANDLRFSLDDTVELLRKQQGAAVDIDLAARLQERTDGWPLAIHLMASGMVGDALVSVVADLSGVGGNIERYITRFVMAGLAPVEADMLIQASFLSTVDASLCGTLVGMPSGQEVLARIERCTGLVVAIEGAGENYRLHPLLQEYLQNRARELPRPIVEAVHRTAAEWYAAHGRVDEAAEHAFRGNMRVTALTWIEARLRLLASQGRIAEVLAWLDRLPEEELATHEGIQLTLAWACTLCCRLEDARRLIDVMLSRATLTLGARRQAEIVRSAIEIHDDDYRSADSGNPDDHTSLAPLYRNSSSYIAIHTGNPAAARHYQHLSDSSDASRSHYDEMYGAFAVGLSYLVEGRAAEAAPVFRRALARAETTGGRRSLAAALQAAGLAAATWDLGAEEEARSLLANRIDLVERAGLPDAVILAYRTLARHEDLKGREGRALDALNNLAEIGRLRAQPRLVAASLAEQMCLQANRHRRLSCSLLREGLEALIAPGGSQAKGLEAELRLLREISVARVALLEMNRKEAADALDAATRLASCLHRGRDLITIRILKACCHDEIDFASFAALAEALGLAESFGLVRVVADDWLPAAERLPALLNSRVARQAKVSNSFLERATRRCLPGAEAKPVIGLSGAGTSQLSAREMEVLVALASGRSNKEIARLLDVGAETVKWHLKHLYNKLGAANRRHAVDRARLLGIIE